MKQKEMLWMYEIIFISLILPMISAVPIIVNATDTLGNNYTLTIDLPQVNHTIIYNNSYISNYTINQTVIYNITNITCINCTNYYNITNNNNNNTLVNYYNKTESENIYVLKTDFQNWKTIEQPSIFLKKTDINYSDMTDSVNKIKNNFTDINTRLDDNSFTLMWKVIVGITLFLAILAIGMAAKVMM